MNITPEEKVKPVYKHKLEITFANMKGLVRKGFSSDAEIDRKLFQNALPYHFEQQEFSTGDTLLQLAIKHNNAEAVQDLLDYITYSKQMPLSQKRDYLLSRNFKQHNAMQDAIESGNFTILTLMTKKFCQIFPDYSFYYDHEMLMTTGIYSMQAQLQRLRASNSHQTTQKRIAVLTENLKQAPQFFRTTLKRLYDDDVVAKKLAKTVIEPLADNIQKNKMLANEPLHDWIIRCTQNVLPDKSALAIVQNIEAQRAAARTAEKRRQARRKKLLQRIETISKSAQSLTQNSSDPQNILQQQRLRLSKQYS